MELALVSDFGSVRAKELLQNIGLDVIYDVLGLLHERVCPVIN